MRVYARMCANTCTDVCEYKHGCVRVYARMCANICTDLCEYMHECVRIHARMCPLENVPSVHYHLVTQGNNNPNVGLRLSKLFANRIELSATFGVLKSSKCQLW